jgi:hypothetical protein|uniref:Uncharacterized protein n=1 Tax=Picea glauca TaxID=3330 RepID=A0A101M1X7_PICGL|nr:hypothetical protein ABT39_MTgene2719 [Picea glauca]
MKYPPMPGERLGLEGELRTMALDLYLKEGMLLRVLVYLVLLPSLSRVLQQEMIQPR